MFNIRVRSLHLIVVTAMVAALALMGIAIPSMAQAAVSNNGVTLTVDYGDESYGDHTVVTPGTEYAASIQYDLDQVTPGQTTQIAFPAGVTVTDPDLSGADAIESVEIADGVATVVFKDPLSGNQQGFFDLSFVVAAPEDGSEIEVLTWSLDSNGDSQEVIVKDPNSYDPKPTDFSTSLAKGVATPGFDGAVSYDPATETITVDNNGKDITAEGALEYTLTLNVADPATFDISDVLDDRLAYDADSFTATISTWTEAGDKVVTDFALTDPVFAGNGFTIPGTAVDQAATLTITYTAHVTAEAIDGIIAGLTNGDGIDDSPIQGVDEISSENGGDIWVDFANTADTDITDEAGTTARLGTHVNAEPQPGVGPAFGKDIDSERETVLNPGGAADTNGEPDLTVLPLTTEYTLTADLGRFEDTGDAWLPKWDLTDDVILRDQLPTGMVWDATAIAANDGLTLLDPAAVPADLTEDSFLAVTDEGDYWLDTATRTLWVNLGQDTGRTWSLDVATVLQDEQALASIPQWDKNDPQVVTAYFLANQANYFYWDGRGDDGHGKHQQNRDAPHRDLFVVPAAGSTVDDESAFDKTIGDLPRMTSGAAYQVPFTFAFGEGAIVDLSQSQIVDHVNHDVFDVTADTLAGIQGTISGSYAGVAVSGADFDLALNDDGDLVITPSDAFRGTVGVPDGALDGRLEISLSLPTHVIQGKQTLDVSNSATVQGGTKNDYQWENTASGSATSYGNELEVEKSVYGGDQTWTQNLRVALDESGMPVQSEFIYRVELFPHGTFAGRAILDITDVLPEGTSLLGFVSDDDLESGNTQAESSVTLDGNLTATIGTDPDSGRPTVVISQQEGTTLTEGSTPRVNFKISIDSFTDPDTFVADLGVTNQIGPSPATITPSDGFPLLIRKTDAQRNDMVITDRNARFTITGPDGQVVTDQAYVVNGRLMVAGDDGADHGIVIPAVDMTADNPEGVPAGRYTVTETVPPAGYELNELPVVVTIGEDGGSNAVTIADEPSPLYAIGDYTWIDVNRDGLQGTDSEGNPEPVLPGVTVELLDAASGEVIDSTTTDEQGRYLFDLLPAGDYRVRFTLTDEQAAQYSFTSALQGDVTADSDADPATGESGTITLGENNTQLVPGSDYEYGDVQAFLGIDPTWDAGVVQKSYAIGDYTWIDVNRDGEQGNDSEGNPEPVLPGVTVELTDPDGNPVTHIDGSPVEATTTNEQGYYLFDNLPAGDYQVRFTLTDEQSSQYVYTTTGAGSATDSDAAVSDDDQAVGTAITVALGPDNTNLTTDYDTADVQATEGIDPTWDAGVVERSYAIGDVVWIDEDRDGLQGTDEPPLAGVTVELRDGNGDPVPGPDGEPRTTTTDENGHYLFDELPPGEYQVNFTLTEEQQKEYRFTTQDADSDDPDADSDVDPTTGGTELIVLGPDNPNLTRDYDPADVRASEGIDPTWDAGVVRRTYAVGDYTWIDTNRDGVQDGGEPVLPGVTVELFDGSGEPIQSPDGNPLITTTDETGHYLFDDLPAGDYQVRFTLTDEQAARFTFTTGDAGDDDALDSDAARGTGLTAVFTLDGDSPALVPGSEYAITDITATEGIDPTWDAGVVEKSYAVGDYTWIDADRDGVQDPDEDVLAGVTVTLLDGDGNPATHLDGTEVAPTVTDESGRYLFDDLPAGDYQVRFTLTEEQAKVYQFTTQGQGDPADDSDADASGLTVRFHLGDDNANLTPDYDRDLQATEGIDPTWDAGVVTIQVPSTSSPAPDPGTSPAPDPGTSPAPDPGTSPAPEPVTSVGDDAVSSSPGTYPAPAANTDWPSGPLATTGVNVFSLVSAGLLVLLGGVGLLVLGRRKRIQRSH